MGFSINGAYGKKIINKKISSTWTIYLNMNRKPIIVLEEIIGESL